MDDMTAFERLVAGRIQHHVGPIRPVDDAAIFTAIAATQSPRWKFPSMFSAARFVVAGAIVALFGGFLLAGVLTQQPSDEPLPPAAASAPSSPDTTTAADESTAPELLPGVDLVFEEFEPDIYRVLSDGLHDLSFQIEDVTVTPDGAVWVELGTPRDWSIVRLGEPGVSQKLGRKDPLELGSTAGGTPVAHQGIGLTGPVWAFDGERWRQTELSDYDACSLWATDGDSSKALGADGGCYATFGDAEEPLVRIDADGTRTAFTRAELGLGPKQNWVDNPVVGPDGTVWAGVGYTPNGAVGFFRGLVRYDGSAWLFIPYDGDDAEGCGVCYFGMAVDEDGVVWVGREVSDGPAVLAWDGLSWRSDLEDESGLLEPPWGGRPLATAPDGSGWTVVGHKLYVVNPEAEAAAE